MSKVQHTAGPWFLEGNWDINSKELGGWVSSFPPSGMPVFEMVPALGSKEQIIANANLIASAPELLEALKRMVKSYEGMEDGNGDPCPDVAHAKSVIAKAEGGAA